MKYNEGKGKERQKKGKMRVKGVPYAIYDRFN